MKTFSQKVIQNIFFEKVMQLKISFNPRKFKKIVLAQKI